jgi:hypothetical protein
MIHHVLRFRFKPAVPADKQADLIADMHGFGDIPAVHGLVVGATVAVPPDGYTHAMVVTVKDEAAFRDYLNHPHFSSSVERGRPYFESVSTFDIFDPADPGLSARLAQIRMERL